MVRCAGVAAGVVAVDGEGAGESLLVRAPTPPDDQHHREDGPAEERTALDQEIAIDLRTGRARDKGRGIA